MPGIIDVSQLVKTYGDGTKAVKGISFNVSEGEFFGFLGPNGAGKSTTIKILTTILRKTSGSASVAGFDVEKDAAKIRKIIGVQNQDTVVDEDLTGRENMILQGELQQMHGQTLRDRIDELLKIVDLVGAADKRAGFYSGGMKKRVGIARGLANNPEIMLYDEPTSGLDPLTTATITYLIIKLQRELKVTSVVVSHDIRSAFRMASKIALLANKRIGFFGTPEEMTGSDDPYIREFLGGF